MEYLIIRRYVQVDEVLSTDSAEEIADDKTPGPMTEINFWEAKCINLESLFEQVFRPRYSDNIGVKRLIIHEVFLNSDI